MKKNILSIFILATTIRLTFAITSTVVTKTADDGSAGTLRFAILSVNGEENGTVSIQTSGTITLLSPLPAITAPMTIVCDDAAGIIISGNNAYRVFTVQLATGTVKFKNLNIVNGFGDGGGGAVYAITSTNGKVAFENCTFSNCVATGSQAYGGAIQSTADLELLNCTLTGNSAVDGGGAIELIEGSGTSVLNINHCTIVQNSTTAADIAGGIDLYLNKITITNSIVANNSNGNSSISRDISIVAGNTNTSLSSYNLYTTAPFTGTADLVNKTIGELGLSALANNGGSVRTMAIGLTSLARNNGTGALTADARGTLRDANPDRGAYEAPSPTATTTAAADITTSSATLNGVYDPKTFGTHSAQFEYGSSTGLYTHTVAAIVAPTTNICTYAITNQAAGSALYYRLVATVDGAKFYGGEQTFSFKTATSEDNIQTNSTEIIYSKSANSIHITGEFNHLEIFDLTGKLILKSSNQTTLLTGLKAGIVIVKVYTLNNLKIKKIAL